MSHLGRKPVRGGRPASESRVSSSIVFSAGAFVHEVIRVDSFSTLTVFMVRKMAEVIKTYR